MSPALWKNIIKDIKDSKARFISIMLIVALGVGFFTGIKATSPSMNETAEQYYCSNNLMDLRLLSTVGFSDDDVEEIKNLDHVRAVSPSYFADVIMNSGGVIRLYSMPEEDENGIVMNEPILKEGKMPEAPGEIALEHTNFKSGMYKIGDTIKLEAQVSGKDTTDTLESLEYTIVGFVQSPLYVSFERGTTTVGSGSVSMYGIISTEEFVSERYTQVYVLTDYSDGSMKTLEDEYTQAIEALKPEFEKLGEERADNFDNVYLVEAQQKLDDAQEELDSEKENADSELADAEKELQDAEDTYNEQVSEGQQQLDDAKQQIDDAEKEIAQGWEDYYSGIEAGQAQIDTAKAQLQTAKEQLASAKDEFEIQIRDAQKQLDQAERQYNRGLSEYESGVAQLNTQTVPAKLAIAALQSKYDLSKNRFDNIVKPAADKIISEAQSKVDEASSTKSNLVTQLENASDVEKISLQTQISAQDGIINLNQGIIDKENEYLADEEAKVNENKSALDDAVKEYEDAIAQPQAQLDSAKEELDNAKAQIDSGKAELATQQEQGQAQLDSAQQQITDGEAQITEGQQELAAQKTEGRETLEAAEDELEQAKEDYEAGLKEFEEKSADGKQQLDDATQEFNDAKAEAEAKIADAQSELDKARETLENLESPEWYIFTRTDNPGFQSLIDDTGRVDAVASVFPLFFLLVAALVCLTTLTRHVEEKRTEIGTLKALGYSNSAIKLKFVIYATSAAVIGCILGITAGIFTLPYVIYNAYGIMYELQPLKLVMPWKIAVIGAAAAFVCTTAVALYTCQRALSEKPSSLMRPKAPKIGKRIFLERIPFIWNKMNFTSKVTARNIMRYKVRFLMTVIGVAGCTALILTGFGLKNSISSIADKQFGEINTYDLIAVLDSDGTAHQKSDVLDGVVSNEYVECAMLERQTAVEVTDIDGKNEQEEIYLVVPQSIEDMTNFIHLRERKSGVSLELTDSGAVITEKMANNLGVSVGDSIIVTDDHKEYTMTVTGITENYIYSYVYISPDFYKEIYGKDIRFNMIMAKMSENGYDFEEKLGEQCLDNGGIAAVSFISGSIDSFNDTVKSLDTVTLVLILCAGLLAIVVLYNLTNINIAERVREIATIKVLGFYNEETCMFVYRENIVLTLCGVIAGLGLGVILHRFVILTVEINKTMFDRTISLTSYLFAALLTIVFAVIVNFVMYFKIKKIDMVESLKSIE